MRPIALCFFLFVLAPAPMAHAAGIHDVSLSEPFFNPTAGQSMHISFRASIPGAARITILDRDRFPIRTFAPVDVKPGVVSFVWDGRDDRRAVVPDEAWNIRIELAGEVYDPSLGFTPATEDPQPRTYSRSDGILSYRLTRPARVHIEAGQATPDPKSGRSEGPILKTIVNREPRVAGAVVERWNGFDESGTIRVSNLPRFVVSVLATSLPDNSIITRGNNKETFIDYARRHRPAAAIAPAKRSTPTHQHAGLNAFEDRSPTLRVKGTRTTTGALRVDVNVEGPTAAHFLEQGGRVSVYVDEKRVLTRQSPPGPLVVTIAPEQLRGGEHRIAVNWGSDYGPAAVNSFVVSGGL